MKLRGPSRIRTGDGGFAIRCPDSVTSEEINQLGKAPSAEVPTVVPSPGGIISDPLFPPDLAGVVDEWDRLPEAIRAAVLTLVQAARKPTPGHA